MFWIPPATEPLINRKTPSNIIRNYHVPRKSPKNGASFCRLCHKHSNYVMLLCELATETWPFQKESKRTKENNSTVFRMSSKEDNRQMLYWKQLNSENVRYETSSFCFVLHFHRIITGNLIRIFFEYMMFWIYLNLL